MTLPPQPPGGPAPAYPRDYLRLARFDHATKHVVILPGIALAWLLRGAPGEGFALGLVLGFAAAICIASANYVINEWLDRDFDAHHPEKSRRTAVQKQLDPRAVLGLYALLLLAGMGLALPLGAGFGTVCALFALAGVVYNVPPLRSKDRAYVDVLSESLNNPIRLTLGWLMVDPGSIPPASLLLAFWLGGAFLMNAKRLAEYRDIVAEIGRDRLALYRRSFAQYDEGRLSVANLVYALGCGFFLAVFLVKYRIEYIVLFPLVTALFAEYYALALKPDSVARRPERLFRAGRLMALSAATALVFMLATVVDMPLLDRLADAHFIELPPPGRQGAQ